MGLERQRVGRHQRANRAAQGDVVGAGGRGREEDDVAEAVEVVVAGARAQGQGRPDLEGRLVEEHHLFLAVTRQGEDRAAAGAVVEGKVRVGGGDSTRRHQLGFNRHVRGWDVAGDKGDGPAGTTRARDREVGHRRLRNLVLVDDVGRDARGNRPAGVAGSRDYDQGLQAGHGRRDRGGRAHGDVDEGASVGDRPNGPTRGDDSCHAVAAGGEANNVPTHGSRAVELDVVGGVVNEPNRVCRNGRKHGTELKRAASVAEGQARSGRNPPAEVTGSAGGGQQIQAVEPKGRRVYGSREHGRGDGACEVGRCQRAVVQQERAGSSAHRRLEARGGAPEVAIGTRGRRRARGQVDARARAVGRPEDDLADKGPGAVQERDVGGLSAIGNRAREAGGVQAGSGQPGVEARIGPVEVAGAFEDTVAAEGQRVQHPVQGRERGINRRQRDANGGVRRQRGVGVSRHGPLGR